MRHSPYLLSAVAIQSLSCGGIAHTFHILIAKLMKDDAKPKVVWSAGGAPLKDYAAFVDAMRSGKLDDRLDHAH